MLTFGTPDNFLDILGHHQYRFDDFSMISKRVALIYRMLQESQLKYAYKATTFALMGRLIHIFYNMHRKMRLGRIGSANLEKLL